MDLSLFEEQRAIGDLARQVFGDVDTPREDLDAQLAASGLSEILRADSGLGMVEVMLVLEAQGRAAVAAPLCTQILALGLLDRFVPTFAPTGGLAISLDNGLAMVRDGSGWRVDGRLSAVPFANVSQHLFTSAEGGGRERLLLLPLQSHSGPEGVLTDGSPVADVALDSVAVDETACLPEAALDWLRPRAIACIAAMQLGVAQEALRRTAAYVSERKQFGRPIGSFQAVMVRAADAYADVEALRAAVWRLCSALDAGTATPGDAEVAKIWAADAGHRVAHAAQHLHGGLGADLDYPLHRLYLRARALEMMLGGAQAHRVALGDWLAEAADPDRLFVDA